jgi:hypothetical protein
MKPIIEPKPEQRSQESEPEWNCPYCELPLTQIPPEQGISSEDHEAYHRLLIREGDWKSYFEEVFPR